MAGSSWRAKVGVPTGAGGRAGPPAGGGFGDSINNAVAKPMISTPTSTFRGNRRPFTSSFGPAACARAAST